MSDKPEGWEINAGYDKRFATVGLKVTASHQMYFPLADFLERLGVAPGDFAALLEDKYKWTEPMDQDIDPARVRLLESVDWKGKTVLDIGGYDGFAAEIAHKGGAARAICLDNHQYEHYGWKDIKKEGVEYVEGDVMDVAYRPARPSEDHGSCRVAGQFEHLLLIKQMCIPEQFPIFDVLINYNVLYHVKNPWAFLDKCRSIINPDGEMLLCTLFRYHKGPWMYVYEPRECNPTDETVYFGPSLEALERLLKHTGWDAEKYALSHDRALYRCKPMAGWERSHEDT